MGTVSNRLDEYGFEYVGTLSYARVPAIPGIYVFTATKDVAAYKFVSSLPYLKRELCLDVTLMAASEPFYVGSSGNLSRRIQYHRSASKIGVPESFHKSDFDKVRSSRVTLMLRHAQEQAVPIDVYIRRVPSELGHISGLPVDVRLGWEGGLIRELNPKGNKDGTRSRMTNA